jgi:hypothetical protein
VKVTRPALCVSSLVLAVSGCAAGDAPGAAAPDTRLHPHLKPEHTKHQKHGAKASDPRHHGKKPKGTHPSGKPTTQHGGGGQSAPASPATPADAGGTGGTTAPSGPLSAQTADSTGDVQGLGAPSFADLTGATLTSSGGYTLVVTAAAALPTSSSDKTMHVIFFADVDGDGQIDYENWATLADNGWSGAWRYPDGAKFGSASGIHVTVSGSQMTMTFPADHVGNADHFRWLVGAEYGSDAQMASGTQSSDYAPDNGSVDFPAR